METSKLIFTTLTSSVLAAALTSLINWLIQRNNYRNDYYKKLLDKRLQAYENVTGFLLEFQILNQLNDGKLVHRVFACGNNFYQDFYLRTMATSKYSFWISNQLNSTLTEFSLFLLAKICNKIIIDGTEDRQVLELGILHLDSMSQFKDKLTEEMKRDFLELHNIKAFIKNVSAGNIIIVQ